MAKLYSNKIEQMLLVCALETRSPRIRSSILTNTDEEDYGSEYGKLGRKRMNTLLSAGKSLGTAIDFAEDAAISSSKGAMAFFQTTEKRRKEAGKFNLTRVEQLINQLKTYRQVRTIYRVQHDVNSITEGNVEELDIEKVRNAWEGGLSGLQGTFDKQPLLHFGNRQSDDEAKRVFQDLMEYKPTQFVSTGLEALDKHLHGFERGNLVTVSAPSSGGKSTMATVMSINQYMKSNHNVCYVSLEMKENELLRRIVSNISRIPHDSIRFSKYLTKEERKITGKAFSKWHSHGKNNECCYTIWNPNDTSFTPQKVETSLAPLMYDVVIIDYITLFDSKGMDTWKMQMEYSRYLSLVAKRLNCVIVLLSQLSDDERIKYGRAILENTDYWLWWPYGEEEEETGNVELRLAKARHGRRARIQAKFMLDIMSIETATVAMKNTNAGRALKADSKVWSNA